MAITPLGVVGTGTYTNGSIKTGTLAIPVSRDIPVGHTLVVYGVWEASGPTQPNLLITDDQGNDGQANAAAINGTTRQVVLGTLDVTTQLNSGQSVQLSADATRQRWAFQVYEFSGVALAGADKTASNVASGTALNGGTTTATAQADEVVFGAFSVGPLTNATVTSGSGFTISGTAATVSTSDHKVVGVYKVVSTTGTQSALVTIDSSSAYAGVTLTLKAAAVTTLLPTADVTTTSWTKTPSGAATYAAVLADSDDATFATCITTDGTHPLVETLTAPGTTPPAGSQVTVRCRARSLNSLGNTTVMSLIQGASVMASGSYSLGSTFSWIELILTSQQVTNITNGSGGWSALKISINANSN